MLVELCLGRKLPGAPSRVGERTVRMREVALEDDRAHADLGAALQAVKVIEDAAEDSIAYVARWRFGEVDVTDGLVPHAIHPLVLERHPADLALGVGELERREPLEGPREDPVADRTLGVLGVQRH